MKLTDPAVRKAKPRKLTDGSGLYVMIHPNGGKYWQLAYRFAGKKKTLALGVYPDVSLAELRGTLKKPKRTHYTTIEKGGFPQLLRDIDGYQVSPFTTYALQLMALAFTRTSELIEARWEEIDLDHAEWLIPAERMKMRRPHLVPLSQQAVAVFREAAKLSGDRRYIFPNRNDPTKPASKAIILRALGRMGYTGKMTGHGFRSAASTILNEHKTKWSIHRDAIELQLANVEKNASRAAYNFAEYLDERHTMMQQWAGYLDKLKAGAEVVALRA